MMRIISTATIIFALLSFACRQNHQTSGEGLNVNSDISKRCSLALSELAKTMGSTTSTTSDRIQFDNDEMRLQARIENDQQSQARFFIGLVVEVFVNGTLEPLTTGSVGIGTTRDEAIQTAVEEWAQLAGPGLLGAFGIKNPESTTLSSGSFSIHQGATGIRGILDSGWSRENGQQMLDILNPIIKSLESSPSEFHSILIMAVVEAKGATGGECRIDGEISQIALKTVQAFRWPKTTETYMFKQYYVLRRMR